MKNKRIKIIQKKNYQLGEYTAIFAAVDEFIPPYVRGRVDIILGFIFNIFTKIY